MEKQHENYYVPEQSKLPLFASIGLFFTVFGMGNWLVERQNNASLAEGVTPESGAWMMAAVGLVFFCFVLYKWFAITIDENLRSLNSTQLKRSYVWGMGWFIFSEVMFFAAFFGALFYVRTFALPWLSEGPTEELLWNGFEAAWPLMETPSQAAQLSGENLVSGPGEAMSFPGWANIFGWLPLWNTIVLLSSSVTIHIAHVALRNDNKKKFNIWLGITVALGIFFLFLQAEEYIHAYHVNLNIDSGVYGNTFFMLTGFHGLHVTMGTFMLLVQWLRSVLKGHFTHDDCFGFEASSWYWHFVDVVWVGLFIFVYVMG